VRERGCLFTGREEEEGGLLFFRTGSRETAKSFGQDKERDALSEEEIALFVGRGKPCTEVTTS